MIVKIHLTLELDDEEWGNDKDEWGWLRNNVLDAKQLSLHSNEIGDSVGKILRVDYISKFQQSKPPTNDTR